MLRRFSAALFVSALVGGTAPQVFAQADQARVTGTVRDASGAAVTGAGSP